MKSFVAVYFDLNEIFIASKNNYLPSDLKKMVIPAIMTFQLSL